MTQNHARRIITALTPQVLQSELEMTERTIRHAKSTGMFAAFWFREVKALCERHGIFCPMDAFNFKINAKKDGTAREEEQHVQ